MAKPIVPVARIRELLAYEPRTGIFIWRVSNGHRCRVGEIAGWIGNDQYKRIGIDGRDYVAHRLAWAWMTGAWPSDQIDHINGVRHDNRFANLREASFTLNKQNTHRARKDNRLGIPGVVQCRKSFHARIGINGKCMHLGSFSTTEEAHAAYIAAKRKWHPSWSG